MKTIKRLAAITFAALMLAANAGSQTNQAAVFKKVFNGITAAQASAAVTNIGQTMHLIYVFFPTQSSTQTGIQVRIEGSYDNSVYFPLSEDITDAPLLGGIVYNVAAAFGPWPYIRVRSLTTAPAAMTVYYSGHTLPAISVIQERSDRFIL